MAGDLAPVDTRTIRSDTHVINRNYFYRLSSASARIVGASLVTCGG